MYCLFLTRVILFKHIYSWSALIEHIRSIHPNYIKMNLMDANYIPTKTIISYLLSDLSREIIINNLVGNLVLFIPFGMLVCILINSSSGIVLGLGFLKSVTAGI